jgi:eukaryotic-like serine/threonine-protein kinase
MAVVVALQPPAPPPPDPPWQTGLRIGEYQIRSRIGRGGMSSVWEAWDTELRRVVALKTVDDPDDPDHLLLNEARALAAVRHPGLPVVYGLGKSDGRRYLVIERLYGETLEHKLRCGGGAAAFTLVEALRVLVDVADLLHAVHDAGMVHHDVKPANIMLCRAQRTVLLDFGVMMPVIGAADAVPVGTPGYLAPEAVLGTLTPGRARLLDVYSFGVIAYETLTGRALFSGSDVMSLMQHHAFTPLPDLTGFRPDVPPTLEALVHGCLAKNPADRPSDMEAVAGELRQLKRRVERRTPTIPPR